MVGVPGKSKGCNTCRRRKVKCDEGRPLCQRCVTSGRNCEGYERYPVFINRSEQGLHKRKHLEEAKSRDATPTPTPAPFGRQVASRSPPRFDLSAVNTEAYAGHFLASLMPTLSHPELSWAPATWYQQAFLHAHPSHAMQQMKQALVETRFSWHTNNRDLYHHGQQLYGHALRLLQQAINDPQQNCSDETLAAIRLMILYEALEASTSDATGWHNHMNGVALLLKSRGPQELTSTLATLAVDDLRIPMMIQAIMCRRSSFLADPVWASNDEQVRSSPMYRITMYGFQMATVLGEGDQIAAASSEAVPITRAIQFLEALLQLQIQFDAIRREILHKQGSRMACQICGQVPTLLLEPVSRSVDMSPDALAPCEFFITLATLYGLLIPLGATLAGTISKVANSNTISNIFRTQLEEALRSMQLQSIGQSILELGEHCLHEELGMLYNHNMIFPLQSARWALMDDSALSNFCLTLIETISGRHNAPFARQVNIGQEHVALFARRDDFRP